MRIRLPSGRALQAKVFSFSEEGTAGLSFLAPCQSVPRPPEAAEKRCQG